MQFGSLLPEIIFNAVSSQGYQPTGALLALNSYENRVYEIGLEEESPIVAKFYRPGRWSLETIADEHRFIAALAEAEIPVVSPLSLKKHVPGIKTLGETGGLFYCFYPKFRGREKAEIVGEDLEWLGRTLARIHNVGGHLKAGHRLTLTPQTYGYENLHFILAQEFIPADLQSNLEALLSQALKTVEPFFNNLEMIPVHGDCHPGNILWKADGPYLLDFDDMVVAPPVQDVWMLFSGDASERKEKEKDFFKGYEMFRPFDRRTLILSEPLRTLRMIRHAAWIGQRYAEPAFQRAFPYYEQRRFWEEFLQSIREQISLLQEE